MRSHCEFRPHQRLIFGSAVLAVCILAGCASPGTATRAKRDEARVRLLERELKKRQASLEELKERNLILEKRVKERQSSNPVRPQDEAETSTVSKIPVPFDPTAANEPSGSRSLELPPPKPIFASSAVPPKQLPAHVSRAPAAAIAPEAVTAAPATAEEVVQTGEQKLYSKVLETYRVHNSPELQKVLDILLKTYPDSVYADNALYLAGILAYELGDLSRAGFYMERVIREFPAGNKTVSALFAKAMIDKRSGRIGQARETLRSVRSLYPGSPEAARAVNEMKFIDLALQTKHGEG